jgi:cytochrome c oxidase cbb3-type subunit 3
MKTHFKIFFLTLGPGFIHLASHAQQAPATTNGIPQAVTDPMNYILVFSMVILLSTILVLSRIIRLLTQQISGRPETTMKTIETANAPKKETIWTRLNRKFISDAVPVEHEADVLLDHDYDGIKELDNNLPPWWKYGFYITIIFAVIYLIQYHVVGQGSVQLNEYNEQLAEAELMKAERLKASAGNVDETNVTLLTDAGAVAEGQKAYTEKCMVCHGKAGEGNVGPNLTDDFWIHGGSISDIFKTIKYGVPSKGMLAWQGQMTPVQMQQVSSFIKGLRGTNPPNAKAPQGDLYSESGTSPETPSDTTQAPALSDTTSTAAGQQ